MPSSRLDSHRNSVQNGIVERFTAFAATTFAPKSHPPLATGGLEVSLIHFLQLYYYTVWVEGLPSSLPSSHRPNLGRLMVPGQSWVRCLIVLNNCSTFLTLKNRLRTASQALLGPTWSDFGAQLGLKPPPTCSKVGFQVPTHLLSTDSHEVL